VTKKQVDGQFFLSAWNSRSIYDISITSGFYLAISFTSEDKYAMTEGWRSEELIISYNKTLRFTVGIKNKSLIIPTEDLRPTSFGPNDIDNIDEVAEINFELLSKKAKSKKMIKIIWINWLKEWREYSPLLCFLSK
jgi:hypothetical protein